MYTTSMKSHEKIDYMTYKDVIQKYQISKETLRKLTYSGIVRIISRYEGVDVKGRIVRRGVRYNKSDLGKRYNEIG